MRKLFLSLIALAGLAFVAIQPASAAPVSSLSRDGLGVTKASPIEQAGWRRHRHRRHWGGLYFGFGAPYWGYGYYPRYRYYDDYYYRPRYYYRGYGHHRHRGHRLHRRHW